jgi:peptidoglycan/LPS O-acetylase OafA/YrhL
VLCLEADFCPVDDLFIIFRTDLRIDGLLCGSLLAFAYQNDDLRSKLSRLTTPWLWLLAFALYLAVFFHYPIYTTLAESVLVVLLIGGTVLHPTSVPGRILESQPLRYIGRMSYGIYLWQELFCFPPDIPGGVPKFLKTFPVNLLATFITAALSFYLLEKPILSFGRRKTQLTPNPQPPPAQPHADEPSVYEEPAVLV